MNKNQTRKRIQKELLNLMKEKSIREIKTIEIAEKSEVSRTTFYKYFESPYSVLESIEEELLSQLNLAKISGQLSTEEFLDAKLSMVSDFLQKNQETLYCILVKEGDGGWFLSKVKKAMLQDYLYCNGEKQQSLLEAKFVIGGVLELTTYWVLHPVDCTLEETKETLHSCLENGIQKKK